jgi:hypothetical protein
MEIIAGFHVGINSYSDGASVKKKFTTLGRKILKTVVE